jgi:hypothetical protein
MRAIALLFAFLAAPVGAAGSWERVDLPDRAGYMEFDRASIINRPDGTRRILSRTTYTGIKPEGETGRHYDYGTSIFEADCDKRLARIADAVVYLRAERVDPISTTTPWTPMPTNSPLYKVACGS